MRLNRLFSVAMLSFLFGVSASAQQPYGGCWHPEHIKNWSPETDKNAKFNRSKVPLAKRFISPCMKKTHAAPSDVPRNGINNPQNISVIGPPY